MPATMVSPVTLPARRVTFPTPELIGAAAGLFPNRWCAPGFVSTPGQLVELEEDWRELYPRQASRAEPAPLPEGPSYFLRIAPGVVQLRAHDLAKAERAANREAEALPVQPAKPIRTPLPGMEHKRGGRFREWSSKSRRNFTRKLASLDYGPFMTGRPLFLGTLTYPGEWLTYAPDAPTVKRHLDNFRRSWLHRWGEPLRCVWKLEFQRRGAPHYHLLTVLPASAGDADELREWQAQAWSDVVFEGHRMTGPVRLAKASHTRVGAYDDSWAAARMTDVKRIAVYFVKHGVKASGAKEYQHVCPVEWPEGPGRYWGTMGLSEAVAVVILTPGEYVTMRRLLRKLARSQGRRLFSGGRMAGGYILANDGAALASQLARALALDDRKPAPFRARALVPV